jgi:hypothetical protein
LLKLRSQLIGKRRRLLPKLRHSNKISNNCAHRRSDSKYQKSP